MKIRKWFYRCLNYKDTNGISNNIEMDSFKAISDSWKEIILLSDKRELRELKHGWQETVIQNTALHRNERKVVIMGKAYSERVKEMNYCNS